MRAAVRERYGSPDVVELREIEKPVPAGDEVLVRVHSSSLNIADWYGLVGRPLVGRIATGLRKPKELRIGIDFAGTVEAVGKNVSHVEPGDEVYGARTGALAEYVCVKKAIVAKPPNVTLEQVATVPVAALTALQAIRDKAQVQQGEHVLVNGASGGVGTFAVQIAKAHGAEVTAVCSTGNVEAARELGADHVVDYTRDDFTRTDRQYDVVLDVAGSRPWRELKRVLTPTARVVVIGAPRGSRLLGPLSHVIEMRLSALFSRRKASFFVAKLTREDLDVMNDLLAKGKVVPRIDRRYPLEDVASAFQYIGDGHCKSKIVITV
jgi:NADPH:quinone reductase-like Zn-dependent oxidoreductase